jgi:hypothetical protein
VNPAAGPLLLLLRFTRIPAFDLCLSSMVPANRRSRAQMRCDGSSATSSSSAFRKTRSGTSGSTSTTLGNTTTGRGSLRRSKGRSRPQQCESTTQLLKNRQLGLSRTKPLADQAQQVGGDDDPSRASQIYRAVQAAERLYQGEIIEGVVEWSPVYGPENPDQVREAIPRLRKLAVVLTQDCDLAQDWTARTANARLETDLPCVLLCPVGGADQAMAESGISGKDRKKPICNNKNERYQYLAAATVADDGAGVGHEALLVDFKKLFTIRTVELYRQIRVGEGEAARRRFRLDTPWAEHLQCRFAAYHARIGLPRDHFIPETRRTEQGPQR